MAKYARQTKVTELVGWTPNYEVRIQRRASKSNLDGPEHPICGILSNETEETK